MNYYDLLVKLCEAKGVTLAQMCKDLGKRYSFVTELKSGRAAGLSKRTIETLTEYFGVPKATFYDLGDSETESMQNELFVEQKLLFDITKNATPEQRKQIVEIAKLITQK